MKAFLIASSLLLFLVACGPSRSLESKVKIYGGKKSEKGDWPGVVALTDGKKGIYCSGIAITPELVITAGHCAIDIKESKLRVYVGEGEKDGDVTGQYRIASFKTAPGFDEESEDSENDIAYLTLSEPLELPNSAYIPVLTNRAEKTALLSIGRKGTIVGFGERDNGKFGIKAEVEAPITRIGSREISIGGQGKDSCSGDSGGPIFGRLADGRWRVFGVTSRGDECGQGGIYSLIDANICWIQEDSGIDLDLPADFCRD